MKYYFVDLRALPISERIAACKKMEQYSWEVFEKVGTSGLESAEVCWTSPEDFESSPCFPKDANALFWETDLTSLWRRV